MNVDQSHEDGFAVPRQESAEEITAYVEAVRAALSGLPEATRDELLEDLPEHLAEVAADDVGPLADRLGPPAVYAAELLASAGFVGGFPDPPARTDRIAEARAAIADWLREIDARTGPLFGAARASEFLLLLRPAWWVLRGYLAAMVVAWVLDSSAQPMGVLPRIGGSDLVALVLLAGGILASIWLGRRSRQTTNGPRYALWAGNAVLVLVALAGFNHVDGRSRDVFYDDANYTDPYGHVRDVFVYDEQGRLIQGARLFDQDGQPIRLGSPYCLDEAAQTDIPAADESAYPYCAQNAPFRMPDAAPTPSGPRPSDPRPSDPTPSGPRPSGPTPSAGR